MAQYVHFGIEPATALRLNLIKICYLLPPHIPRRRILDKGADTDILNEDKHTPLQIAQNYKHPTVIELLGAVATPPQ